MHVTFAELQDDLRRLDERVVVMDKRLQTIAREHADAKRLMKLRGVGPMTATAIIAALGDGKQFAQGRMVSAWAGIVPRQHSSGGKERLLGISKRGDSYLRTLLIHGARAVVRTAADKEDNLSRCIQRLCARRNKNVAAVALANKTLRMAWALLLKGGEYDESLAAMAV
jgi:transposase